MANKGGQWGVAGVNGAVALVLILMVGFLALVVNPPSPPGIAAFAPQAEKQITKAPLSQSSSSGEGAGACVGNSVDCALASATSTTTTIKGKPTGVPSALQCFKWPDGTVTQTFDPQSPPCVATWDDKAGNGGATSPGVTATEIRVALPTSGATSTWPALQPIVDFFNTRFQLYGRKIKIQPFNSTQANDQATGKFNEPEAQRADAAQITQLKVFASTDFVDPLHYSWSLPVFRDTLTRNKIVSLHGGEMTPYGSSADLIAHYPYEWTFYAPAETVMRAIGTMACRQLVGKNATHAPGPSLRTLPRKFAIVFPGDPALGGPMPGLDGLKEILNACGVVSPRVVRFNYGERTYNASMTATMRQLQDDNVTSIFWFPQGGGGTASHPWSIANSIGYRPEWLMVGWNNYQTAFELKNPSSESSGAFGVGDWNKMPALEQETWARAYLAAGGPPNALQAGAMPSGRPFYQELLLLASGIQMAGPNLTPETFGRGLQATKFPNPGAAAPPFYQGTVGFKGDTTMVDDLNLFWLDIRMPGNDVPGSKNSSVGRAFCYVNNGSRVTLDSMPTTDGFYQGGVCR